MGKKSSRTLAAAIAAGALIAIPSTASASPAAPSTAQVKAYTVKADVALDRAVAMFTRGNDRPALRSFRLSRAYLGKAKSISSRLTLGADTDVARTWAAQAWCLLAKERDENLAQLVELLKKVDAKTEKIIAAALLADTKHRDAAIGVIQELINAGVMPWTETSGNRLISALTSGRAAEIGAQMNVLAEVKLPADAQRAIAVAIQENVGAQARVAVVLNGLIPQLPEESRAQLQRALDLAYAQLAAAAKLMEDLADLMPPFVRPLIVGILDDVKQMIEAITAPLVGATPSAPASPPVPPTPPTPATPGVDVPNVPVPFPVPMPSWVLDIINQYWPAGMPVPPTGIPAPGMEGFWESFFGENGFMSGFFGEGGFMSGFGGMFGGTAG